MRARTLLISTIVAVGLMGLTAAPASAVEVDPYTPISPDTPSLSGSSASSACIGNVPYIDYNVVLTDPDGEVTTNTATLILSGAGGTIDIPLGTVVDGKLSGRVLWPGAAVDGSGNGTAWPGWEQIDGEWFLTGANYGWTRGDVSAVIYVNPSISVPLSYPSMAGECNPTAVLGETPTGSDVLATTGAAAMPWVALGLGAAAVLTGAALLKRRRATS